MKNIITYILLLTTLFSFAQTEDDNAKQLAKIEQNANDLVYNANDLASSDDFLLAEMEYRKALSTQPTNTAGAYNLGHSYYEKGNFDEALYRNEQAIKSASTKAEKHKAFHNIGNILMQNKKCKEAVDAFKNALRNDPTDDESRYNLGLAKECAKNQEPPQEENDKKDEDKDKEENEDEQDKDKKEQEDEGENKDDNKDKGNDDKKEGEDEEDKGKPEEKEKDGKGDEEKKEQQKPQQQPGQLSPQQIKNLLEAMNNQEQKVQEKINAEKAKGAKVQTEKDW